jgi:hypothetical protein
MPKKRRKVAQKVPSFSNTHNAKPLLPAYASLGCRSRMRNQIRSLKQVGKNETSSDRLKINHIAVVLLQMLKSETR